MNNGSLTYRAARFGRRALEDLQTKRQRRRAEQQRGRIEAILARPDSPQVKDAEAAFEQLQRDAKPPKEYGYQRFDAWWRGVQRCFWISPMCEVREPGKRVLEATCGDGMTGHAFASYGHEVTLHDLEDWRDARAKSLPFVLGSLAQPLALDDAQFDLVFSYNAFEHIDDPAHAIKELVRVCKPGGHLYIDFGPLYASAWGLHAYRTLRMPYPQYLFGEAFREQKFKELGLYDLGRDMDTLQPLNRWTPAQFEQLFRSCGCEVLSFKRHAELEHLHWIERFPQAFSGRGLTFDDVTVTRIDVHLRKPQ